MKIKIVKATMSDYWYADRIGDVYDIIEEDDTDYYVEPENMHVGCRILKEDAETVKEIKIVKCHRNYLWYADQIGEVFQVTSCDPPEKQEWYSVKIDEEYEGWVLKSDAEIVNESVEGGTLESLIKDSCCIVTIFFDDFEKCIKYQVMLDNDQDLETKEYDKVVELLETYGKVQEIIRNNK